ncbi:SRPBCC family protein [Aureibacter tunicatorum]|uniref:Polyketide cyclase / dehydrase and lipid transport n=1 Tax=Aureibacter tunicatorum TaxID=866807 RepID=A0AAE3XSI9_9BACT|nr:SRPBCC family protein [Aureibacter tunicatorum]MDR6240754.1 hypothetical protein [Aureibacter tunicatorum]BDD06913.1 hypothetical protein AUTU_43960 [Aureibacter tunicatorum]
MFSFLYVILCLAGIVPLVFLAGCLLPKQRVVERKIKINAPLERVWDTVTDIANQGDWRSDLEYVKVIEDTNGKLIWEEKPCKGKSILFEEVEKVDCSTYRIKIIESSFNEGHWIGRFSFNHNQTTFISRECIIIKNPMVRLMSYFIISVDKLVETYQQDLKEFLETSNNSNIK